MFEISKYDFCQFVFVYFLILNKICMPCFMQMKEARALLGRLEYQKGNFDAALQVFYGIDIKSLAPRMIKAISDRTVQQNTKSKKENGVVGLMSLHSVSLLLEAILLKAKSLQQMGRFKGTIIIPSYPLS